MFLPLFLLIIGNFTAVYSGIFSPLFCARKHAKWSFYRKKCTLTRVFQTLVFNTFEEEIPAPDISGIPKNHSQNSEISNP